MRSLHIILFLLFLLAQGRLCADELYSIAIAPGLSGRLVFVVRLNGLDELKVLDLDEGKVRSLVAGPGNSTAPSWSADGRHVVFVSDRDGNKELYTSLWDGTALKRLTQTPVPEDNPVWSPDGTEILFSRESVEPERAGTVAGSTKSANIFALAVASGKVEQLTRYSGRNIWPRYVPGKREVLYVTDRFWPGSRLSVINRDTGIEQFLFKDSGLSIGQPSYGKDANELFFVVTDKSRRQIGIKELTGRFTRLVVDAGYVSEPTPLPEGSGVIFVRRSSDTKSEIRYISRTGKEQSLIVEVNALVKALSYTPVKTITVESQRLKEMPAVALNPLVAE